MTNRLRIGFIGCGRVAEHYKLILERLELEGEEFEVAALCDRDFEKAHQFRGSWDVEIYDDVQKFVTKSNIDLVIVCSPSGLHYRHTCLALTRGLNVLVEKPPAMKPSEVAHMAELAEESRVFLSGVFQNRFNPAYKALTKAVVEKRFGTLISVSVKLHWCRFQSYYDDDWHGSWSLDGGVVNQQAIHHLDALCQLVGLPCKVSAVSCNVVNMLEAEDTLAAVFKFSEGFIGTFEATTALRPQDVEASLRIVGTEGIAQIGGVALNKIDLWNFNTRKDSDSNVIERYSRDVPNGYGLGHLELIRTVFEKLRSGQVNAPIDIKSCIPVSRLVHSLYESAATDRWVNLDENVVFAKLGDIELGI